ncbi:MAG: hypothetical protein IKX91_05620 [Firmicutes bacterium]|nr:hypothetical protein [Bacillota bacterium]
MRYLIALDSGGTKTEAVLFREDGRIVARELTRGADALTMGADESKRRIRESLRSILGQAPGPVSAVFAGIAGTPYYPDYEEAFADIVKEYRIERFRVGGDGIPMISSCLTNNEDGCCLICGTGCGLWIRRSDLPKPVRIGGWGYLIDTLGSGYILGRDAFRAVCFAYEGRGEKTLLTDLILNKEFGGKSIMDATLALYEGGRPRIASLAHTVFEAKRAGDPVAKAIVERGANGLVSLLNVGEQYFEWDWTVVLGGGIFKAFPEYADMVRRKAPAHTRFVTCETAPVFGDAVEALHLAGLDCTEPFRRTFEADYAKQKEGMDPETV